MPLIEVKDLCKEYQVLQREKGFAGAVKSLFHPVYLRKQAVKNVSFEVDQGESIGYIGMNGAGKSTTIKMLSGILTPTSGSITVGGIVPYQNRVENARQMGVVFGQRSRLNWDLPMGDSFELYRKMYEIDAVRYQENIANFTELLGLKEFFNRPVRQLSLGEKMRANLALAFLHDPQVVYLDEPTIGLDVVAKSNVRKFIREMNQEKKVTIMLTTHDMADIEQICDRLIFIHQGQVLYDGSLTVFKNTYGNHYTIDVESVAPLNVQLPGLRLASQQELKYVLESDKNRLKPEDALVYLTSQNIPIKALKIHEASIENIIIELMKNKT